MEPRGLMRIKSYVGKLPLARNFEDGAEILRWLFEAQFTKLAPQDWIAFAQRTWREGHGTLVPSHDPKLARTLRSFSLERLPTLWTSLTRWRASRLWLYAAQIQICWPGPP
jgi:hypothetical protein